MHRRVFFIIYVFHIKRMFENRVARSICEEMIYRFGDVPCSQRTKRKIKRGRESLWRSKERRRRPVAVTVLLLTLFAFPSTHNTVYTYTVGSVKSIRSVRFQITISQLVRSADVFTRSSYFAIQLIRV